MVTVTQNGNIPQQPANWDNSYVPDQLIAGVFPRVTHGSATIKSGAQVNSTTPLPRGTVLGQITAGAATAAAKSGGNTGNGTCTSVSSKGNAVTGVYTVRVVAAGTNAATLDLYNPNGEIIDQKQYSGSGATAVFSNDQLAFTITDGATDFVVGDGFDITVAAPSNKWVPSVPTATDGSQNPAAILADQSDPSGGDVNAGIYYSGEFNSNAITFDSGWTVAALTPLLRAKGIYLKASVSAADPS